MVRLYSHCSYRYLTLLLVNGRYAYANFVSLAVLLFLFPRVFRRCIVTAARPQEHGGVPHLRRDDVRARGRPDGSNALQYARRTNVQVRKNKICTVFLCRYVYEIYLQNIITSSQVCGTVVTVSIRVYPSCHIQPGSGVWSPRLLRIQLVWITSTQARVYWSLVGYSTQSVPFCKERRNHHRTWLSMVS